MNTPSANDLFRAAQDLIREGQPVFPCRAVHLDDKRQAKAPLTRHGLHDATLDKDQIRAWLKQHKPVALGTPTGIVWDVLDVDIKEDSDGRVHLPYLARIGLLNGCKKVVKTPSGGWHLYFKAAPTLTNKARGASLGLDVRAKGGYVLAPPSYIETDEYEGSYEDVGATTGSTDEPLYWDQIVSALAPFDESTKKPIMLLPSERRSSLAALREFVSALMPGERNNGLFWAVCRCIESGLDPHELVEPALLAGLGEDEVMLSVDSALKRAGVVADDLQTEAEALFPDSVE